MVTDQIVPSFGNEELATALFQGSASETKSVLRSLKYCDPSSFDEREIVTVVGAVVDLSEDFRDKEGINAAIIMGENALNRASLSAAAEASLHYCIGGAYATKWRWKQSGSPQWESHSLEHSIQHYRTALNSESIDELGNYSISQIYTNLGNMFSNIGRVSEAIGMWDEALEIRSNIFMAIGNRGQGIYQLFGLCSERAYTPLIASQAYYQLKVGEIGVARPKVAQLWGDLASRIDDWFDTKPYTREIGLPNTSISMESKEQEYREWCAQNRMFLNPLNEIYSDGLAMFDILKCTFESQNPETAKSCHGLFNQIIQEFVFARWLLYQGFEFEGVHYSDRLVRLKDTLEYAEYGYHVEMLKTSLRLFYSIFDKIAFFLNFYFDVGLRHHNVDLDSIWNHSNWYTSYDNRALCALYWLYKDLDNTNPTFVAESLDPGIADVRELRRLLEHRYTMFQWLSPDRRHKDKLAEIYRYSELEDHALRAGKKVRSAILYLAMSVWEAERSNPHVNKRTDIITWPVYLDSQKRKP